jgi:hypothetical protein
VYVGGYGVCVRVQGGKEGVCMCVEKGGGGGGVGGGGGGKIQVGAERTNLSCEWSGNNLSFPPKIQQPNVTFNLYR